MLERIGVGRLVTGLMGAGRQLVMQLADQGARPQDRHRFALGAGFRQVDLQRQGRRATLHQAMYRDFMATGASIAALQAQRLPGEQIGNPLRTGIADLHPAPVNLNIGQDRRLQTLGQFTGHLFLILGRVHVAGEAAPDPAHFIQQVTIDPGPYPKGVQPGRSQIGLNQRENFGFVADVAVGQKGDETQSARWNRRSQGLTNAGAHLGAAFAIEPIGVAQSGLNILRSRRQRLSGEFGGGVAEADDAEAIGGPQPPQRRPHEGFAGVDGQAVHRPGAVQHKHHFAGGDVGCRRNLRRLQQQAEKAAALIAVRQQTGLSSGSGQGVAQHEIAIIQGPAIAQPHLGPSAFRGSGGDWVGATFQMGNRHAGVDMNHQSHPLRVNLFRDVQLKHRRVGGQLLDFPLAVGGLAIRRRGVA